MENTTPKLNKIEAKLREDNRSATLLDYVGDTFKALGISGDAFRTARVQFLDGVSKMERETKLDFLSSDCVSPYAEGKTANTKNPTLREDGKSTCSTELWATMRYLALSTLDEAEQTSYTVDLAKLGKKLKLTNRVQRSECIAYVKASNAKTAAGNKINEVIKDAGRTLKTRPVEKKDPPTQVQRLNKSFDNVLIQCDKMIEDNPLFWNNIMKVDDGGSFIRNELRDIFNKFGWIETK
tara:strand:- start:45 stop:758 length:714 start_codon:yes stop_codon:yes gene_type:complete